MSDFFESFLTPPPPLKSDIIYERSLSYLLNAEHEIQILNGVSCIFPVSLQTLCVCLVFCKVFMRGRVDLQSPDWKVQIATLLIMHIMENAQFFEFRWILSYVSKSVYESKNVYIDRTLFIFILTLFVHTFVNRKTTSNNVDQCITENRYFQCNKSMSFQYTSYLRRSSNPETVGKWSLETDKLFRRLFLH